MDSDLRSIDNILPLIEKVLDNPRLINILTIDSLFKKIIDENNIEFNISPKITIQNNFDNINSIDLVEMGSALGIHSGPKSFGAGIQKIIDE